MLIMPYIARLGTLEFVKARVRGDNPFSATVYGPATSFDFRFSIITNTRESAAHNQEIEDRVRRAYRYSAKRGLLVNHSYENNNGYAPLVNPKSRLVCETAWIRGDIKVIINEIQDGIDSTFQVKLQSNLLKKYTREEPGEVPLTDIVDAMKDFLEAAEEINGKLNILTADLPSKISPTHTKTEEIDMNNLSIASPSVMRPIYETLSASVHSPHGAQTSNRRSNPITKPPQPVSNFVSGSFSIGGGRSTSELPLSSAKSGNNTRGKAFMSIPGGALEKVFSEMQSKDGLMNVAHPATAILGIGTETFWESRVGDDFGIGIPVLAPTRKALQGASTTAERILLKHDKLKVKQASGPGFIPATPSSGSSAIAKQANNAPHKKSTTGAASISDPLPPHLRPVVKASASTTTTNHSPDNPSLIGLPSPSIDFSDRFFDLLGSATDDTGPSAGVLTPRKAVSTGPERVSVDFFGSVGSLKQGDAGDLMSWSSDKGIFAYENENDVEVEVGEGVSLLLD